MKTDSKKKQLQVSNKINGQIFYLAFQNLAVNEKKQFLTILAKDKRLMEDLIDISIMESRKKESSRSFREILND